MPIYALVVFTADDVQLLTACTTHAAAVRRLARYVRERAEYKLPDDERAEVHRLLDGGRTNEAVHLYFSCVAARWDREHWKLQRVDDAHEQADEDEPALFATSIG